jgi:hypothetical protein
MLICLKVALKLVVLFWPNLKGPNHFVPEKIELNNVFWQFESNNQKDRMLFGPKMAKTSSSGQKRARARGGSLILVSTIFRAIN